MKQSENNTTRGSLSWRGMLLGAAMALLFVGVGVGATLLVQYSAGNYSFDGWQQKPTKDGNVLQSEDETSVASVAKNVSPSVVSILSKSVDRNQFGQLGVQAGAGSGIIVGKSGYVLTNKHVVDNARDLQIMTSDGKVYENVEIITKDPLNDLAYLKINGAKDLPAAQLGDSSSVKIGQRVIAIGNSLGQYQNTVTTGIISGTGRPIAAQNGEQVESLSDLLQTDAAINPGNSGGPLLNMAGQVIGVNTAVAADAEGIGFAIPVNAAKGLLKQVLGGDDDPRRALLGVRYVPLNVEAAEQYKLDRSQGAYVTADESRSAVQSGSPADKAGIKAGDIITKVEGQIIGDKGGLSSMVAAYAPGEKIELTYVRDGQEKTTQVTLSSF